MLPDFVKKSVEFIQQQQQQQQRAAAATDGRRAAPPFFLYLALTSPHTPIVPGKSWNGKSGLGAYADFVMQTDAALGAITDALRDARLDAQHPGHLHQRQRLLARRQRQGPRSARPFPEQQLPRLQGRHLGRRPPRPVHRPLARGGEARPT